MLQFLKVANADELSIFFSPLAAFCPWPNFILNSWPVYNQLLFRDAILADKTSIRVMELFSATDLANQLPFHNFTTNLNCPEKDQYFLHFLRN